MSSSSSSTSPQGGKSQKPKDRPIYDVTEGIASSETKKKYAYHFQSFLNHFDGLTVQSLIEKDKRTIEAMIIKWIHYLSTERKQKNGTIHHEVAAVLHWCDFNDISLNKKRINSAVPEDEEIREDRCYDLKEIEQVLSKCDESGKVIILLKTSTGMRIGALPTLKFGDLQEVIHGDVNSNRKLYKIQVYGRTRHKYYTYCTPECKKAIDEYRTFREIHGETIEKESPLIRELFDTEARYSAARPKPMRLQGLQSYLTRTLQRAEAKSKNVMRSHGFRKFYVSQCIAGRVDYNTREYLVGHRHSRGLDVHYDRTTEGERLAEYSKAIELLTISSEEKLTLQVQESQRKLREVDDKDAELDILKGKLYFIAELVVRHSHILEEQKKNLINFIYDGYREEDLADGALNSNLRVLQNKGWDPNDKESISKLRR